MAPDPHSPGASAAIARSRAGEGTPATGTALAAQPRTISRDEHCVSRKQINAHALKVLYRLHKNGFAAHLVGGGVRDLLLGVEPSDFDIVTDATPEEIRGLFRNCRLIGRRFRLAHVVFGREIVEVATFRADHRAAETDAALDEQGRILRDNVFGTIEEDAFRRDFTVNALYYDISQFAVLDYAGGMDDLEARRLRLIGDPEQRYREDPVRMLRAARFAAKLDFDVEPTTAAPMAELGPLLHDIPPSRLFEEVLKLFQTGYAVRSLDRLRRHGLLQYLFPQADAALDAGDPLYAELLRLALENTDRRLAEGKSVTPAFLFAIFLWPRATALAEVLMGEGESPAMAMQRATARAIHEQQDYTSLPKRFSGPVREIWLLQGKLERFRRKRARQLLGHPRLRAAWDFMCLRRDAGEDLGEACQWWEQAMAAQAGEGEMPALPDTADEQGGRARRGRRRRGGRRRGGGSGGQAA